jgi:hypothetical protein
VVYNVRDMLGHFVAPKSAEDKMCPHACCRNKRVHPANMPVILPSKLLQRASDEDLAAHYERVQGDSRRDERARAQVLHEMDRRDNEAKAKDSRAHARYSRQLEQAEAVEQSYVDAEAATNGYMLNRKGMARGINERTLITAREETFRRYASDELLEYYSTHHRPTAASFRGEDTRVHAKATEPRRRQRGVIDRRPAGLRQIERQRAAAQQRDRHQAVIRQHDQHRAAAERNQQAARRKQTASR